MREDQSYYKPFFRNKLYATEKTVLFNKDLLTGENELLQLAQNPKIAHEVAWVYLKAKNIWANVTENIKTGRDDSGDIQKMSLTMPNITNQEWKHYHTHPKYLHNEFFQRKSKEFAKIKDKKSRETALEAFSLKKGITLSLPSEGDIKAYKEISEASEQVDSKFGIVSPFSVMNVKLERTYEEQAREYKNLITELDKTLFMEDRTQLENFVENGIEVAISETIKKINEAGIGVKLEARFPEKKNRRFR